MKTLTDILINVAQAKVSGVANAAIAKLCIDSRTVSQGDVFFAMPGVTVDGHTFIAKAIGLGASVVVCQVLPNELNPNVAYVQVPNVAIAAGLMADAYFGFPSSSIRVVGVTGTNGKTTTATLLYKLYEQMGFKCGLISTVANFIHDQSEVSTNTTPDAVSIHALLARMVSASCKYAFMEVSSHAVHQHRIAGIRFAGGVFTNITHDHLDYHKTFDEYIKVKKSFFDELPAQAFALTNADDKRGMVMLQNTRASKQTYSLRVPASYKGKVLENSLVGLHMVIDNTEAHFRMIGTFKVLPKTNKMSKIPRPSKLGIIFLMGIFLFS